jgi:TonB dependent receptor-like, beta-barrel/Carboxypeptidase regulatory-like domain/TonB-dependent Receptor Plug Domain
MMKRFLSLWVTLVLFTIPVQGQSAKSAASCDQPTLRGHVIDAGTGEPIAKVRVIVTGSQLGATTDDHGDFVITGLPAGEVELYVTTVGYGLVKKRVSLNEGEQAVLRIALSQEGAPQLGEVTVTAGPFPETETNVASEQTLNKAELQTLATVLVADPVRAAQALPGVTSNDDFRTDISLRGAGPRRIGFYLDGLSLPVDPTHTKFGDDNAGQISILNADSISSVSLFSGAFPVRYADSTAGVLSLETREGNRVNPAGRITASLLSSSATFDGPMAAKRGAWLVTARKSYLGYLLGLLNNDSDNNDNLVIDFTDGQAKAVYDLSARHQVGVTAILGRSDIDSDQPSSALGLNDIFKSGSTLWLFYGRWNYSSGSRLDVQTRLFGLRGSFDNENPTGLSLQSGQVTQWGVRSDFSLLAHPQQRIEGGTYLRALQGEGLEGRFSPSDPRQFVTQARFDRQAIQQGYYVQDTWTRVTWGLALTAGVRIDRTALTGQTVVTPRAAVSFAPRENTRVRLGWGQYSEFPGFNELFGVRGSPRLRAERATHYNAAVEHLFGDKTRIVAEVYDREDSELLFSLDEPLIRSGHIDFITFPFRNSLMGYARGLELTLQRRSANRLTGWVSYSYSKARLRDLLSGLSFVSDHDQRHTVSAYGNYRLTTTLNLSALWRFGSGLPLVGFFRQTDGQLSVGSEYNRVRLPSYSRVDLRINKAFYLKRAKLTLSGEILNVLARGNFRQNGRSLEELLPFLPSIGIAIDF